MSPAIERLKGDGEAANFLSAAVVASLLKAERMHAEQDRMTRDVLRPFRQHAGYAVAQAAPGRSPSGGSLAV
ncbi:MULTISPECIES: hypothetical protein [unclassified Mesorhizobium]|uniref:hypothetical protein n=1 Tax=unclassified Mesorhizobium TaxID=325217 RepID=UPI001CD17CFB|nr:MULTISPECIES: hypothetical protein [unclassified Mesorhizobium]MCA0014834.1 hypothetical protein [Mesorhizobium sp. B294B1A1]